MKHWASIVSAVAMGAACLIDTTIAAQATPKGVSASEFRAHMVQRVKSLPPAKRITAWVHASATSTSPLVYVSLVTGIDSGITNIYQPSGSTLQLVGQLPVGGGPVAVDSAQNVYVTDFGNLSSNQGYPQTQTFVYARGATTPKLVLQTTPFSTEAITVAHDGTVYEVGPPAAYQPLQIMKWAPGATTGALLPSDPALPGTAANIAVDSSGNVILGVRLAQSDSSGIYHGSDCVPVGGVRGCIRELAAGSSTWTPFVPYGSAATNINVGPLLGNGEVVVGDNEGGMFYDILVAFPNGSQTPSRIIPLDAASVDAQSLTFGSDGTTLWAINSFSVFSATLSPRIWELGYPSGSVLMTYVLPQSTLLLPFSNAIAVSPAYYPN
jgi:hypothetical protein